MIPELSYCFKEPIWLYTGKGTWYFVTLPETTAKQIKSLLTGPRRGWGSLRVSVTIGKTTWKTSIFPYQKVGSFILPLKAAIRKTEKLKLDDKPKIRITVLE